MVHEDQGSPEGSVSEIEKAARQLRRMEDQWNVLMAKCTNLTEDSWAKLHNATTYLTPEDCLSAGLIDEIIEARK
jgi:ATP-dependent protease ClpP protease subunit